MAFEITKLTYLGVRPYVFVRHYGGSVVKVP